MLKKKPGIVGFTWIGWIYAIQADNFPFLSFQALTMHWKLSRGWICIPSTYQLTLLLNSSSKWMRHSKKKTQTYFCVYKMYLPLVWPERLRRFETYQERDISILTKPSPYHWLDRVFLQLKIPSMNWKLFFYYLTLFEIVIFPEISNIIFL